MPETRDSETRLDPYKTFNFIVGMAVSVVGIAAVAIATVEPLRLTCRGVDIPINSPEHLARAAPHARRQDGSAKGNPH